MADPPTPKLYLVRSGPTTWTGQERIDSVEGAPLTEQGQQEVRNVAAELVGTNPAAVYTGDGQPERASAKLVARAVGAKVKTLQDLREFDHGLWQGLTHEEIRLRNPRIYRQWVTAPESVRPPGGETLAEARERLGKALRTIRKRHKSAGVVLVLRPVLLALLRTMLEDRPPEDLRALLDENFTWMRYEIQQVAP